ncbi:MBL fold metallo-hydrolase [Bacillus sp. 1P06AnD]|uniref:MBL fold metallo-hydrolase n=1 Tax=Bacillus sp. 1P06AnD TaxID=3132208 RepID=UPI0039A00B04
MNSVRVIPIECKFGPTSAYAYYIDAPEPALIDAGVASSASLEIETVLAGHGIRIEDIRWILLTHGHVDHLGGARAVWEKTGGRAAVVIPKKEAYLLRDRNEHIADYKGLQGKYMDQKTQEKHIVALMNDIGGDLEPAFEVSDGHQISIGGGVSIKVFETPGHSIGSVTFVLEGLGWAFAADAVQMYGGARSGMPTIENPALYRQSIEKISKELQPDRLYLGHHFRDGCGKVFGPQIDGDEVAAVLQASLDMDAKLVGIANQYLTDSVEFLENDEVYGPFKSIADELHYTGDPRNLPCAFFVTMNGYQEELNGAHDKWEEENLYDPKEI